MKLLLEPLPVPVPSPQPQLVQVVRCRKHSQLFEESPPPAEGTTHPITLTPQSPRG